MTETAAANPADALNEQDLEAVNAGLSLPGLIGSLFGSVVGGGGVPGAMGPGPLLSATPVTLQGGCPVLLSSKTE